MPKKIGYFGLFGQQNWGNECTLQAIICNARKYLPDWEMYCICTGPEDTSIRYKIPAFPMNAASSDTAWAQNTPVMRLLRKIFFRIPMELLHWIKAFRVLRGTHMLIAPGTGLLTDFERNIFGRCYEIFKWSVIAKLCGTKLLFVSIGAGPIRHPMNRWFIKSALSMADYRSYRNESSRQYLERIGFKTNNDHIYPDLAFSLPRTITAACTNRHRQRPIIGVGVADRILGIKVYYNENGNVEQQIETIYRDTIDITCSFVGWLLQNNYTVRLLLGDSQYDNEAKKDLKNQIIKRGYDFDEENIIDEPIHSVEQLIYQLATTEVVISPRFHNIILALMLIKPVISLSYHEKFQALMTDLELEEYCQSTGDLSFEKLKEQFTKIMSNAEDIKKVIKLKTEGNQLALEKQYSFIFKDLPLV